VRGGTNFTSEKKDLIKLKGQKIQLQTKLGKGGGNAVNVNFYIGRVKGGLSTFSGRKAGVLGGTFGKMQRINLDRAHFT